MTLPGFGLPPQGEDGIAAALAAGEPALIVERPDVFGTRQAEQPLEVTGWAWSGAGIEKVIVAIDNQIEIDAIHDLFRPDLRALYGDQLATAGFAVRIDPRDWPTGWHELTVIAIDNNGQAIGITGQVESVQAQPPPQPAGPLIQPLPTTSPTNPPTPDHQARQHWAAPLTQNTNTLNASHRTDLHKLPYPDNTFDTITCFETLEHTTNPTQATTELHRILTPHGTLITTSTPHIRAELQTLFAHVAVHRQQTRVASLIGDAGDPRTRIAADEPPGRHHKTIATATNGDSPPAPRALALLAEPEGPGELEMWRHRTVKAEVDLAVRQTDAYWNLHLGNQAIAAAAASERDLEDRLAYLERQTREARDTLSGIERSPSWRITRPLRWAKRRIVSTG